jgi:hypothetical protein
MTALPEQLVLERRNERGSAVYLWLEPWAEEFKIAPQSHVSVTMRGLAVGEAEIDETSDQITIYAPGGALLDIRIDGVLQSSACSGIAAPATGALGTKGFVSLAFGNSPEARPGGAPRPKKSWQWFEQLFRG